MAKPHLTAKFSLCKYIFHDYKNDYIVFVSGRGRGRGMGGEVGDLI